MPFPSPLLGGCGGQLMALMISQSKGFPSQTEFHTWSRSATVFLVTPSRPGLRSQKWKPPPRAIYSWGN